MNETMERRPRRTHGTPSGIAPIFPVSRLYKTNLHQATEAISIARRELEAVRSEMDALRATARDEIARCRAALDAEVEATRRAATEQGLAEGRALLADLFARLEAEMQHLADRSIDTIQTLSSMFARKIIDIEFAVRPQALHDLIRNVLSAARYCREITLVVNPDEYELISSRAGDLRRTLISTERLDVRADPNVPRGGVYLETNRGVRDGSVDAQLARLAAELAESIRQSPDGATDETT